MSHQIRTVGVVGAGTWGGRGRGRPEFGRNSTVRQRFTSKAGGALGLSPPDWQPFSPLLTDCCRALSENVAERELPVVPATVLPTIRPGSARCASRLGHELGLPSAAACIRWAQNAKTEEKRRAFPEMAAAWAELATKAKSRGER